MRRNSRIERRELALFCRQLSSMLTAGIDILVIFDVMQRQADNPAFREMLSSIEKDMRLGRHLSEACERFPETFSPFFISMIRQGERDDELETVLLQLADHVERDITLDGLSVGATSAAGDLPGMIERAWPLLLATLMAVAALSLTVTLTAGARLEPRQAAVWIGGVATIATLSLIFFFQRRRPFDTDRCAFCGRTQLQVRDLVRGRGVAICEECVSDFDARLTAKREAERKAVQEAESAASSDEESSARSEAARADREVDIETVERDETLGMEIVKEKEYY